MSKRSEDQLAALRTQWVQLISKATGAPEHLSLHIAVQCIDVLRQRFAGEEMYIPRKQVDEAAVLADFNGRNRNEVCRKHGIGRTLFYKILKRHRHGTVRRSSAA